MPTDQHTHVHVLVSQLQGNDTRKVIHREPNLQNLPGSKRPYDDSVLTTVLVSEGLSLVTQNSLSS